MMIRNVSTLIVLSITCLMLAICQNGENVELLKSHLCSAINESDRLETARLLDRLLKLGIDPKTLPVEESADLILEKANLAYQWESVTGDELVQLYGPLEGVLNGTWMELPSRGAYFWGLMKTGQRNKALNLWSRSEEQICSVLDSPESFLSSAVKKENREQRVLRTVTILGARYFIIGFLSSEIQEDKLKGVELAKKHYRCYL